MVYNGAYTICIKMELQKLSALALLVMAFVAYTCASPIAQPKLKDGYVESGQCKVLEARGINFRVIQNKFLRSTNLEIHADRHFVFLICSMSVRFKTILTNISTTQARSDMVLIEDLSIN